MSSTIASTFTPSNLMRLPDKAELNDAFVGTKLSQLRTPALIIDRSRFKANCERVTAETQKRGMTFRSHVKTHKTAEGTRMQVEAAGGVRNLIASTMPEVWGIVESGLVAEGKIDDILYSLPIGEDKIEEINDVELKLGGKATVRLMVDHPEQIRALDRSTAKSARHPWTVFLKVDGGGRRAGVPPTGEQMKELVKAVMESKSVQCYGFYSHFGQSYASKQLSTATDYFHGEIECVNSAAKLAREMGLKGDWVLSVGATPTVHAAVQDGEEVIPKGLEGSLELHAGNYCVCDLQQQATSLVNPTDLALTVIARVVSLYPHRSEAMCDAGALAVSKDTGPLPGYGHIISPPHATSWDLGRVSQEHGTLTHRPSAKKEDIEELKVGDIVRIVPQHACLVCAGHPWIYVVEDDGDEVVDVWVPWKGW